MKKLIFGLAVLALVFASSCNKDDDNERSCATIQSELTAATTATFGNDATEEDCNNFVSLGNEFIAADCGTEDQRAEIQVLLDAIDCSIL